MTYRPEDHTYWDGETRVPSVTQILSAAGLCGNSAFYRAGAADRGSRVHAITEELDRYGEALMEIDAEAAPYVASFQEWARGRVPLDIEVMIEGDWPMPYAGRVDRLYKLDGLDGRVVVDIKTGNPAPWHRIQLQAYALALEEPNAAALYIRPDKPARLVVMSQAQSQEAIQAWAEACKAWREAGEVYN